MFALAVILLLFIGICLLFSLCANVLFWYETLNAPERRIPALSPDLRACLGHYARTVSSYFLCLGLSPFGPVLRRPPRKKETALPPVILVHGLLNNSSIWLYLGRRLEGAGYPLSTFGYPSLFRPLEKILEDLDDHVRRVEEVSEGRKPVFLCHSLGGLIVRRWLGEDDGRRARTRGVITLGTPHGGSRMAVFAPGALARSIRPDGALAAGLRKAAPLAGFACVSLVSPEDEAVLPAACLLPPPGWTLRLTPPVTHFFMLFSPSVAAMVLEDLRGM
jgi:pimeloyl-ACP methyl ester carboxylesterase